MIQWYSVRFRGSDGGGSSGGSDGVPQPEADPPRLSESEKRLPPKEVLLLILMGLRVVLPYLAVILAAAGAGWFLFRLLFR